MLLDAPSARQRLCAGCWAFAARADSNDDLLGSLLTTQLEQKPVGEPEKVFSADPARIPFSLVLALVAALCLMYAGTYRNLWVEVWSTEEQAHGPLIVGIVLWLCWQIRARLAQLSTSGPAVNALGWVFLMLGCCAFVVGRSQDIVFLDVGSQIPVFAGLMLLFLGWRGVRAAWFPLLYLVFLIPLPGIVIDTLTGPLKQYISEIAEWALYHFGYPIARQGVVLQIGQYQLLVADACSGLHSMFSLSALGLLYMYMMQRKSKVHNAAMLLCILPIAFLANVVRVIVLILVTYYLGDEAGQGFLHGAAGIVLLVAALLCLFMVDGAMAAGARRARTQGAA